MKVGAVSYVVLGALAAQPRSGYEIKRLVDKATRFFWAASYGQIYPELRRLQQEGLIAGKSEPRGGRQRIVYSLTPAGRQALLEWLRAPSAGYELRDEGLLKLFFADALEPSEARELLRAFRAERQAILDRLRQIERGRKPGMRWFPGLVLRYGIDFHEWVVAWCDRAEQQLASRGEGTATGEVVEK